MNIINYSFIIFGGILPLLFGIGAFLNPNLARFINAPGGPRIKAIISMIIGAIFVFVGLTIDIPIE